MENNALPRALVFGSTGLIGSYVIDALSGNQTYSEVVAFNRRPSIPKGNSATEVISSFATLDGLGTHFRPGDHLFICLGTTIRKAGSVKEMDRIDREIPVGIANLAHNSGASRIAVVSSLGARADSRNYYMRIKGLMEQEIAAIPFERTLIVRPSILYGPRKEFRFGEAIGKFFMKTTSFLMVGGLRQYRGIHAEVVANAMIRAINQGKGLTIMESEILKQIVDR